MKEQIWAYITERGYGVFEWQDDRPGSTEYIRADVAAKQLGAERERITAAVDAILTPFTPHDVDLRAVAMAIKRCVWSDDEDPREVLRQEISKR